MYRVLNINKKITNYTDSEMNFLSLIALLFDNVVL